MRSNVWLSYSELQPEIDGAKSGSPSIWPTVLNLFGRLETYTHENDTLGREKGHSLSFDEFFASEFSAVFRAVYLYTGERELSEDAAQEGFSKAYSRWDSLHVESWAKRWVIRTSLNVAKRRLKRERLLRKRISGTRNLGHSSPPGTERVVLVDALRQLPDRQREAVVLFYIGDLSITDVAAAMGISTGAVKAHLSQARPRLRNVLEVEDD